MRLLVSGCSASMTGANTSRKRPPCRYVHVEIAPVTIGSGPFAAATIARTCRAPLRHCQLTQTFRAPRGELGVDIGVEDTPVHGGIDGEGCGTASAVGQMRSSIVSDRSFLPQITDVTALRQRLFPTSSTGVVPARLEEFFGVISQKRQIWRAAPGDDDNYIYAIAL